MLAGPGCRAELEYGARARRLVPASSSGHEVAAQHIVAGRNVPEGALCQFQKEGKIRNAMKLESPNPRNPNPGNPANRKERVPNQIVKVNQLRSPNQEQ